jgi:hypothetical protein
MRFKFSTDATPNSLCAECAARSKSPSELHVDECRAVGAKSMTAGKPSFLELQFIQPRNIEL